MVVVTSPNREVTELQLKYLTALRDGKKLGKQMRGRLRRWGVRGGNGAFYRVVKRLKDNGLLKSERVPKSKRGTRPQEFFYELTHEGSDVAGPELVLFQRGPKRRRKVGKTEQTKRARARVGR